MVTGRFFLEFLLTLVKLFFPRLGFGICYFLILRESVQSEAKLQALTLSVDLDILYAVGSNLETSGNSNRISIGPC